MFRILGVIFLGCGLGANDSANVFGTGVSTGVIRYRHAVVLAAVFVLAGALIQGQNCINGPLSELAVFDAGLAFLITLSAGLCLTILTILSLPVSSSQAVVGALVAVGLFTGTASFKPLVKILIAWVATPLGGGLLAWVFYKIYLFFIEKHIRNMKAFYRVLRYGIVISGCYGAYSLGANNVANTTGVFVSSGLLTPFMASLVGGLSIGLGSITYSRKVMKTVGKKITMLHPLTAFLVVLAEAVTVHIYTFIGIPVSTSQAVVGAVIGIGLVKGVKELEGKMIAGILGGWVLTPFFAGLIAAGMILLFRF